jgi:hypothetical protein
MVPKPGLQPETATHTPPAVVQGSPSPAWPLAGPAGALGSAGAAEEGALAVEWEPPASAFAVLS